MEGIIQMTKRELDRLNIVNKVIAGQMTIKAASKLMGLSYRQSKRVVAKVRKDGDAAIIHQGRGKASPRKLPEKLIQQTLQLYKSKYPDFGPTFANEKLFEIHQIKISKETLRKHLIKEGLWESHSKKNYETHMWRERKHHAGEMIQIDGSHHRWLEDRLDQEFCLMGYIDDADGKVYGRFYEYEGILPAFDSFEKYIKLNGTPKSIYIDRHSTYKTSRKPSVDEELNDAYPDTQFERVMKKIGVEVIHARSPEAKGRVERSFATHQDRLVKEMRLANICTIEDANKFLPGYLKKHNEMFAIEPKSMTSFFRKLPDDLNFKSTFSLEYPRTIATDYTVRWNNRLFLISNPSITLKKKKVILQLALNGDIQIISKNKILSFKEITEKDLTLAKKASKQLIKILKNRSNTTQKDKKSWMDNFNITQKTMVLKT